MGRCVSQADLKELIGKDIWFRCSYCDINQGRVEQVLGTGHVRVNMIGAEGLTGMRRVAHANDIFLTKEDLMGANYERYKLKVESYGKEVTDIVSLVKFCYDHPVSKGSGDNLDMEARQVARMKAMELLGVEIDPEAAKLDAQIKEALSEE